MTGETLWGLPVVIAEGELLELLEANGLMFIVLPAYDPEGEHRGRDRDSRDMEKSGPA